MVPPASYPVGEARQTSEGRRLSNGQNAPCGDNSRLRADKGSAHRPRRHRRGVRHYWPDVVLIGDDPTSGDSSTMSS